MGLFSKNTVHTVRVYVSILSSRHGKSVDLTFPMDKLGTMNDEYPFFAVHE